jgi:hypothetical protein
MQHRMDPEARKAYGIAIWWRARKTAALIRAGKASTGYAIKHACIEISKAAVTTALLVAKEPGWAFCMLRYVPDLTRPQRFALCDMLTDDEFRHAKWALDNMRFLDKEEREILEWIFKNKTAPIL